jgi:hypothetical protein
LKTRAAKSKASSIKKFSAQVKLNEMDHAAPFNKFRSIIETYFHTLSSQVDTLTDKELVSCGKDKVRVERVNAKRAVYQREIKECERSNLILLNQRSVNELESLHGEPPERLRRALLPAFCFLVQFKGLVRVISTDVCLSDEQVALFKSLLHLASVGAGGSGEDNDDDLEDDELADSDYDDIEDELMLSSSTPVNNDSNKMPFILQSLFDFTTKSVCVLFICRADNFGFFFR